MKILTILILFCFNAQAQENKLIINHQKSNIIEDSDNWDSVSDHVFGDDITEEDQDRLRLRKYSHAHIAKSTDPMIGDQRRLVTFYNIAETGKVYDKRFPQFDENCEDVGIFSDYEVKSISRIRFSSTGVFQFPLLGFNFNVDKGVEFKWTKKLIGVKDRKATHRPYIKSKYYQGEVWIQYLYKGKDQWKLKEKQFKLEDIEPTIGTDVLNATDC